MSGPKVGERVRYVSPFRTGVFDGVVTKVNEDGTVALNIYLPGLCTSRRHADLEPSAHVRSASYGPEGRARPL